MLGEHIRTLRSNHGLTVRQLAAEAEVSPALVSQVERGITDPSLETLRRIAQALGVSLFDLFQEPGATGTALIKAGHRMLVRSHVGDLTYSRISPGSGKLEVLEGVLEPGGCSSKEPWTHPSEECAVVTSGRLVVEVAGRRNLLEPGDSCYFDSRLPHRYLNEHDAETVFILSVTPPSY